jgi:hypothetical protein
MFFIKFHCLLFTSLLNTLVVLFSYACKDTSPAFFITYEITCWDCNLSSFLRLLNDDTMLYLIALN